MPERWINEVVGDEARPRPGFENELARGLQSEWRRGHTPWRAIGWVAAAAILLIGTVAVLTRSDDKKVVPADTTVAAATTVAPTAPPSTVPDTTTEPTTSSIDSTTTTTIDLSTLSGVPLYLAALAAGEYGIAAQLLNEGGLEPEARADMRPLFRPEFGLVANQTDSDAVAAALEKWCAVAWCVTPIEVTDLDDGRWTKRAVFPTPFGSQAALFTDYVFEGQEGVTGLPPMRPIGGGDAMVVNCPTDSVQVVAWADLDGDGWLEQLIGRSVGDAGFSDEDNTENFVITTCGTALQVEPFAITGDSLAIYPVNPTLTGGDMVLIGFLEGYANGGVYSFDGQRLVQVQGPDGPATFAFAPFIAALPAAETFGCAVGADGGTVLVNRIYRLIGGNELSNSTSMELTTVEIITGVSTSTTFDLPEQAAEAGEALIGFCNGLPIQTY